ncbi:Sensory box histidine kinase [Arcticibacter svalbardensis MN12-7]|uniref:Sensory box histidine kinase n=1 Tax=Arcticibacter svalbardensis MN12-7 TaxID=1150600 RepID=R9H4T5_9SPHI|nr:PAS domain S-box protein [Arcticibacter svalbardensis]EOR96159.1 Sensory box histidine kinase [Arcticibacter svalbardensis MN12-7]
MPDNEEKIRQLEEEINLLKSGKPTSKEIRKKDSLDLENKNSHLRFKTIFEQTSLGNKFINSDLQIIKVNKALVRLLGYSAKELIGTRITDIVLPEFVENWKKLQHELWSNKNPSFSIDTCIYKKDRNIVWCHITSILLTDRGETLGYTILEDVTERKVLENDLKEAASRESLFQQQLLEATIDTQEKERSRIAEDLHNGLGQILYGIKLSLDQVKFENAKQQMEGVLAIKKAKELISVCIKDTKRISHDLMPTILEDFGLKEAVQDICQQINGTITMNCRFSGLEDRLPKHVEIAIYRIIQELTTNIIKHANATKASLRVGVSRREIRIRVEDNGNGFNVSKSNEGSIGIRSIKSKLYLLKGKLEISSKPDTGTVIDIQLPRMVQN